MNNLPKSIIKEACVENLEQALLAQKNGADRIELCARLDLGGTTPSDELVRNCLEKLSIPIKVMIRSRGGDFIYNEDELIEMSTSIARLKDLGIKEFVVGTLTADKNLDESALDRLTANNNKLSFTFHKAIDEVTQVETVIKQLKKIPAITSILSSGQERTAKEGIDSLKNMLSWCGEEIKLIVAGNVTQKNLNHLHSEIYANEYHGKKIVGDLNK